MGKLQILGFIILCCLTANTTAQQEPNDATGDIRYISDDLQTFMHSGPGRNYRILGSVVAGTRVTVLQEDQEKGFIEIIDNNQRTGWVETQYIMNQPSIRAVLPGLQQDLSEVKQELVEEQQSNELLNQQVMDLTNRNERLIKDFEAVKKDNERLQRTLDTQDQTAQMQWLTRGGIIALVSIILGVIIAYLPKKRRRNDQWM
ncbi:MAG: TIGR04211 family SH3 domain-containing protein [Aliiglaciecola sp.]|uniref:TIGR04211 family SH3 domain-containing protein n=1 Tax=Aliiglaciecola sp. M165 TaxID=2593649 RepID=UPI00117C6183|nr:TIGR04211 family SH3 domain-containing protein [Aliiglaciecola sp. M165]TRY32975.1 TIGR04211 family SH3 domain-containing protein [Aliiglaciecola sp. M165]